MGRDVRNLLFKALKEKKEIMTAMKRGLISLIPKSDKDKRILDNLQPITFLNADYKIFSGAICCRLMSGISSVISETQSEFLKGRYLRMTQRTE